MAFDEQGQAVEVDEKVRICTPGVRAADASSRLPARGHHLRSQHPHRGHGHRGAQQLRGQFHRGDSADQSGVPGREHLGRRVSNISFSFRGNDVVREAMHAAFLYHAIQAGLDMGIVNAGQLAVYERYRAAAAGAGRRRAAQPPARRHRAAGRLRRDDQRPRRRRPPRPTKRGEPSRSRSG